MQKIRELNELEYMNFCIGQPYNLVVELRIRGKIDLNSLQIALNRCQQRHPMLRAQIQSNPPSIPILIFDKVGPIPLTIISHRDEFHSHEIGEKELTTPFQMGEMESLPLMRVTLLHGDPVSDIILCTQHVITDGLSMGFFVRDLLKAYDNINEELPAENTTFSSEDLFPPKIRKNIPKRPWMFNLAFIMVKIIHWMKFHNRPKEDPLKKNSTPYSLKQIQWTMSSQNTKNLIIRCKQEHVSVHSAICTAFLPYFPTVNNPVNMRQYFTCPINDAFGLFAGGAIVSLKSNPSHSFWSTARKYHHKLRIQMQPKKVFRLFRLFSKCVPVSQVQAFGPLLVDIRSNQAAFGITNLGSLDKLGLDNKDSPLQIESLTGGVSGTFDAIVITVFTLRQQLHFGLRYFASNHSEEEMQRIIHDTMNRLNQAI